MSQNNSKSVTEWLDAWRAGDTAAADEVFTAVYSELRRLATAKMRRERVGHTLQPTALVNEAFLRLCGNHQTAKDRSHFLAIAGRVMMQVLTDHAREHRALKRGGGALAVTLDSGLADDAMEADVRELREAMERLAELDPRKAEIVAQRFLCGATVDEVAEALGVSGKTVQREWAFSKAWLIRELST